MSDYTEHLISMAGGDGEAEATPSGMAVVLAAHYEYNWEPDRESWECQCGHLLGEDVFRRDADPNHIAHQAAVMTAAGFGPVAEAKAVALEEAADKIMGPSDVLLDGATCRWNAMELRETAAELRKP